jgi:hypothetical protein
MSALRGSEGAEELFILADRGPLCGTLPKAFIDLAGGITDFM